MWPRVFCLTHDTRLTACNVHDPPLFTLVDNQIAIPSGNRAECLVFIYIHPNQFRSQQTQCGPTSTYRWSGETLRISGISVKPTGASTGCLLSSHSNPSVVHFKECDDSDTGKWIFGPPGTLVPQRRGGNTPLLLQHHQFMEHQAIIHENILAGDIRKIYCVNIQMRKYMTICYWQNIMA